MAVGATVPIVSVACAVPFAGTATLTVLKVQVGGTFVTGVRAHARVTLPAKPFCEVTVTVEVAELPALMVDGEIAETSSVNPTGETAVEEILVRNAAELPFKVV